MTFIPILAIAVGCDFVIALVNTLNKEKSMIQSGGEPLPTSSYVFLFVRYALWMFNILFLLPALLQNFLPLKDTLTVGNLVIITASFMTTYVLATLEEVLIRVLLVITVQKRRIKQLKKQAEED